MTDLGNLAQGESSGAFGINDSGQVVGYAHINSSTIHAFIWTAATGMVDIGTPGGSVGLAFGINNNGVVTGEGTNADGETVAFLWTSSGGYVTVGAPGYITVANAINDSNRVTGYRFNGPIDQGFVWNSGGRALRALGYLPSGSESVGYDINNLSHVVGVGRFPDAAERIIMWTKRDGLIDLGTPHGSFHAVGYGINDNDEIVGNYSNNVIYIGLYWSSATGFRDLRSLFQPSGYVYATAINKSGQIAGHSAPFGNFNYHPVIWNDSLSAPQDLGLLPGGIYGYGEDINNLGQVVGSIETRN